MTVESLSRLRSSDLQEQTLSSKQKIMIHLGSTSFLKHFPQQASAFHQAQNRHLEIVDNRELNTSMYRK